MNHHLNTFRFYNESNEKEIIENNLSRAFSICLNHDALFFHEYIKAVVRPEHYDYLFSYLEKDSVYTIDLQYDTANIEVESYSVVYGIAMTTSDDFSFENFFDQNEILDKKNITDIFISLKDIAIIIEVKRTEEDCKSQLFNQISPFIKTTKTGSKSVEIIGKCFSWQKTVTLMEKLSNAQIMVNKPSFLLNDFLELSKTKFPNWFNSKPFSVLPFSSQKGTPAYNHLIKRLRYSMFNSSFDLLNYNDRLGIQVDLNWATEIIPELQTGDDGIDYMVFYIWPGNTKQQGYFLFNKNQDWTDKTSLKINGKEFYLEICIHLKLSHFNRFVSAINLYPNDLKQKIDTSDNFYHKSGKWNLVDWPLFEPFMDDFILPTTNWREQLNWEKEFKKTDRTYFTMSLGYEVSLHIPYTYFKELDKREESITDTSNFMNAVAEGLRNLIY